MREGTKNSGRVLRFDGQNNGAALADQFFITGQHMDAGDGFGKLFSGLGDNIGGCDLLCLQDPCANDTAGNGCGHFSGSKEAQP